jgi:hyperosmotically inducible periplasmic protein
MIRGLLRLVVVVVLLIAVAAFVFGYRWAGGDGIEIDRPAGTSGVLEDVDTERARETGAAIGERVATGANQAQRTAADASLTAKIKAKMALDDHVTAANIDVDSAGSEVTLSGRVGSEQERARALTLARETDGVTSVIDRLQVTK